jgi:hypothetical protein
MDIGFMPDSKGSQRAEGAHFAIADESLFARPVSDRISPFDEHWLASSASPESAHAVSSNRALQPRRVGLLHGS